MTTRVYKLGGNKKKFLKIKAFASSKQIIENQLILKYWEVKMHAVISSITTKMRIKKCITVKQNTERKIKLSV